jgi:rubrerythrin
MDKMKLEALSRAIELEMEGRKFYLEAAAKSQNDFGKQMFQYLADQELRHQERIKAVYETLERGGEWPSLLLAMPAPETGAIFGRQARQKVTPSQTDKEAVQVALELEEKSYDYYNELARQAAGLFEKRFFVALSYEERGHYLVLLDALDYLSDPSGWLERHEKAQLD